MKPETFIALFLGLTCLSIPACKEHEAHAETHDHVIVVTNPKAKDIVVSQQYVCQIHAQRNIKVRALQSGYLEPIRVKEGQWVKKDQVLFTVIPTLYKAKLEAELAEAKLAELELNNTKRLHEKNVVSIQEVMLYEAKLAKAKAKAKLAESELNFSMVKAPYDGILDRQEEQEGSLIKEGDVLTTLSDNSLMWVYFNVPEKQYLEYMTTSEHERANQRLELVLSNGTKFPYPSTKLTIEGRFNNETGNIPFRADFPNPEHLLRHGMTGTVVISKIVPNAIVIPQGATFEILDRRYVYVVDKSGVVRQREIQIQNEMDDIFVIKRGVDVNDRIVYEGVRQVRDGAKVEVEFRSPDEILKNLKFHAE